MKKIKIAPLTVLILFSCLQVSAMTCGNLFMGNSQENSTMFLPSEKIRSLVGEIDTTSGRRYLTVEEAEKLNALARSGLFGSNDIADLFLKEYGEHNLDLQVSVMEFIGNMRLATSGVVAFDLKGGEARKAKWGDEGDIVILKSNKRKFEDIEQAEAKYIQENTRVPLYKKFFRRTKKIDVEVVEQVAVQYKIRLGDYEFYTRTENLKLPVASYQGYEAQQRVYLKTYGKKTGYLAEIKHVYADGTIVAYFPEIRDRDHFFVAHVSEIIEGSMVPEGSKFIPKTSGDRDLTAVKKANSHLLPVFSAFIPGDKLILKFSVNNRRLDLQKSLSYFGFKHDSVNHPRYLDPATYRLDNRGPRMTEYLISISTEAEVRSFLAFLKHHIELDEVEAALEKVFVSYYVHTRNGISVSVP